MPITTDKPVTPAVTATEYATKFSLPETDESVQWVKSHQKEYLDLVRAKNGVADRNGLDSDKFAILMVKTEVPNMATDLTAESIEHRYVANAPDPQQNPRVVSMIKINTAIVNPGLTPEDREAAIAHEMGHHLKQKPAEKNQDLFKKLLGDNFSWGKPGREIVAQATLGAFRDDEMRADKVGSELLGGNAQQMITALQHMGKLTVSDGHGHIVKIEDMQSPDSNHPTIPQRVEALREAEPEIRKGFNRGK